MSSNRLFDAFNALWETHYSSSPPLSYVLRELYPEKWLRVHSLPESKRYPETTDEWALLLERHFTVLREVFGDVATAFLVSGYYTAGTKSELPEFLADNVIFSQLAFQELPQVKLGNGPSEPDDTSTYWPLVSNIDLTPAFLGKLFRATAQDECRAFILHKELGTIIAPYDGGIDIFLADTTARNFYRNKYNDWLSTHPTGL